MSLFSLLRDDIQWDLDGEYNRTVRLGSGYNKYEGEKGLRRGSATEWEAGIWIWQGLFLQRTIYTCTITPDMAVRPSG